MMYTLPAGRRRRALLLALSLLLSSGAVACGGSDTPTVVVGGGEAATLNLQVANAWIMQAAQRPDGGAPLVADRDAWVRVFVTANEANTARPTVRVRFFDNGVLVDSVTIPAPGPSVADSVDAGSLDNSWDAPVPAQLVRPGLSFQAVVNPSAVIPESSTFDNVFPSSSTRQEVEVREVPPLRLRFVPIQNGTLLGQVPEDSIPLWMGVVEDLYPVDSIVTERRSALISAVEDVSANSFAVLNEVRSLQRSDPDGAGWIYVGVVDADAWPSGSSGLAFLNGSALIVRSSSGRDAVLAHQLGHSFGRDHPGACTDIAVDPDYPYPDDDIGHPGLDLPATTLVPADTKDFMGFCDITNAWISDYTWEGILRAIVARGTP